MDKQKRYYTVKEASKVIGVSTNTIYKYLEEGSLKGRRLNSRGRFKIPLSEIAPYTTEKETVPTPVGTTSDRKVGSFALMEVAIGVILGLFLVNFFPEAKATVASAAPPLVTEIALATWDYSGRTSTGFGNLVLAGGSQVMAGSGQISKFLASRIGPREPEPKVVETPKEEVSTENFVLITVPGGSTVNLREEADSASKVIAKIEVNEVAEKTAEEGDWSRVAINGFPAGWVGNGFIETSPEAVSQVLGESTDELIGSAVVVNETPTGWLRVRAAPGGEETGKVYPGDAFKLIDTSGEWFLVEISSGQNGWISSQYASVQPED